jgi:hypothetical protein
MGVHMKNAMALVMIIIVTFSLYFFLTHKTISPLSVNRYDPDDGLVVKESLELTKGYEISQSMLGVEKVTNNKLTLMSMEPVTEKERAIFTVSVDNIYGETVTLNYVNVYRNDVLVYKKLFSGLSLEPDASYPYKSQDVILDGNIAEKNTIQLDFVLTKNGQQIIQSYDYNYYVLIECIDNVDCSGIAKTTCDKENLARFSTSLTTYCVFTCVSNAQCGKDQLCLAGRCGY